MSLEKYAVELLDFIAEEVKEYHRQVDAGLCKCDIRTWIRRREKGEYHYELDSRS